MGVRTKVIPLTRQFTGAGPVFEASDDYLKTVVNKGIASDDMPDNANQIENRVWAAADELRANSRLKSSEYAVPSVTLIHMLRRVY